MVSNGSAVKDYLKSQQEAAMREAEKHTSATKNSRKKVMQ